MLKQLRPAISVLAFMTLVTGVVYPLTVTGVAQLAFPAQANGSLITGAKGEVLGSSLLAQPFNEAEWFAPRPSAAGFATVASGASNLAPSNPVLAERITADAQRLQAEGQGAVPMQLVTTSASGLDPHLSPAAAQFQIARIAAARGIPAASLERLIEQHVEKPLVGPAVVNVLALNLALADNSPPAKTE
ncbi:potassium-transporting ATPase subunit C [Pseudomonas sp. HMWF032]|uniref:potassium-transporting ATPase subunit KdpC n=1 Tax=Pseudomonas sp. HMWF032 TaxID=2056866 RepID=UPI000D3CA415|nr:potassium-transporting ATPase subunit KdpC [Pseudomonas sp. HMWF032]PTS86894.1 potassium-transporting ATPase subunit C [Pseudomonas sp. HMWF032]PTT81641.1 potassium-transporting ATPase subunit C [Pseudomonas sp. HMWF010]